MSVNKFGKGLFVAGALLGLLASGGCGRQAEASDQAAAVVVTHATDLDAAAISLAEDVQATERKAIAEYRASRGYSTEARGGVAPVDVALAVTPITLNNPYLLKQLEKSAAALIPAENSPELLNSTVTVHSVKEVSVDAQNVIADVELNYQHPLFSGTVIDSREVIAHRITINQKTGDIVADEVRDQEWMTSQGASAKPGEGGSSASGGSSAPTPTSTPR